MGELEQVQLGEALERLTRFLDGYAGEPVAFSLRVDAGEASVAIEWGREAPDSPMAGAAAYGSADTTADAVHQALDDTRVERREVQLVTRETLAGIAFEAAGAGTAPLMADHPDYVFPAEQVADRVRGVLAMRGIDVTELHGYAGRGPHEQVLRAAHDAGRLLPFTDPEVVTAIATYLDGAIREWRQSRDTATAETGPEDEREARTARIAMADSYVDAFQSARVSLIGSLLPPDTETPADPQ